jgi:hypothetical protein
MPPRLRPRSLGCLKDNYVQNAQGLVKNLVRSQDKKDRLGESVICVLPYMYVVEDFHSTNCYLGDLVGFYMVETHLSPCIQVQALSYNGSTATKDSANPSASTPTTPQKTRLGEALSTPILSGSARSPTLPSRS